MTPIQFSQANGGLESNNGMSINVATPICIDVEQHHIFMCFKMTWRERFAALFFGRVWAELFYQNEVNPIALTARRTIFATKPEESNNDNA